MEFFVGRMPDQVGFVGVAKQVNGRRIDELDQALAIDAIDAVTNRGEDAFQAATFGVDRLAVGDHARQ